MNFKTVLTICFLCCLVIIVSCKKMADAISIPPTNTLWLPYFGSDTSVIYYPDFKANYFVYSFKKPDNNTGIRIKGSYSQARYLSFNVYDVSTGNTSASIFDLNIMADNASVNPFQPGVNLSNPNRNYTVNVLPTNSITTGLTNKLFYPGTIDSVSIFLRYYLPAGNNYGNVSLPTVEAFDISTGKSITLPRDFALVNSPSNPALITPLYSLADDTIRSYKFSSGTGLYANADNQYLLSPIVMDLSSKVALVKIKLPTYAATAAQNGTTDVRYFSFNEGDSYTKNYWGIYDSQLKVTNADGFTYLMISSPDVNLINKAATIGANFLEWKVPDTRMVLLYRNLLTNSSFSGNIQNVTLFNNANFMDSKYSSNARNFIGDYAPRGILVTKSAFLAATDITKLIP